MEKYTAKFIAVWEEIMKLAIFDFDGTLLRTDTLPCLAREWKRQGRSKLRHYSVYLSIIPDLIFYGLHLITKAQLKYRTLKKFNNYFKAMNREEVRLFFLQAYPYIYKQFNSRVVEEIHKARTEGYHCVLLSGAYVELLNVCARDLGIDTVIGFELAYKNEIFDPEGDFRFIGGDNKLSLLKNHFAQSEVDWEQSRSYGDSYTDLCVMEIVGDPVAVNPDSRLKTYADNQDWRIIPA